MKKKAKKKPDFNFKWKKPNGRYVSLKNKTKVTGGKYTNW